MKFYELTITRTCKPYGTREEYYTYDRETIRFQTIDKVKEYLKIIYGNCKKERIYRDTEDGVEHIGFVYCFIERALTPYYWEQHWVDIEEMTATPIIITA
jgi:hypothetical protein